MEERVPTRASATPSAAQPDRFGTGRINGLDGLRAIAVLAVLIYHLDAQLLPGGYLGVDIFFVVSGFLITTLLLNELISTGRVSLAQFWRRRALRLLPALIVVILVSTALGFLIGNDLLVGITRQVLGVLTFSNNWFEIAAGSSYFSHTAPALFANFWSLAVEEQFYLLWPFGFLLLLRYVRHDRRILVALGCALASALLMAILYVPGTDATRVYFGTDTHAFGLMTGVALAFAWSGGRSMNLSRPNWLKRRVYVGLSAAALMVVFMVVLDPASAFAYRGGILLACVATALLVLTMLEGTGPLQSGMNQPVLVWIGQRSYGIYLWHWPALLVASALAPHAVGAPAWWFTRIVALLVTVLVAALSFRYLEQPIRRRGFRAACTAAASTLRHGHGKLNGARLAAGVVATVVFLASAGILTAPAKSQVQLSLEQNQLIVSQSRPSINQAHPAPSVPVRPTSSEGSQSPASGTPMPYPSGNEVLAIGDSLVVTSADGLRDRFPGITFDALSNRQWPDGAAAVNAGITAGRIPRAVILDFGTNAGISDASIVSGVLDRLGPSRMIVLVNLYGASPWVTQANRLLASLADGRSNVVVADWNRAISRRPDLLQPDQIHPGILGAHLYADTIKAAFHELAVRTGGAIPAGYAVIQDY